MSNVVLPCYSTSYQSKASPPSSCAREQCNGRRTSYGHPANPKAACSGRIEDGVTKPQRASMFSRSPPARARPAGVHVHLTQSSPTTHFTFTLSYLSGSLTDSWEGEQQQVFGESTMSNQETQSEEVKREGELTRCPACEIGSRPGQTMLLIARLLSPSTVRLLLFSFGFPPSRQSSSPSLTRSPVTIANAPCAEANLLHVSTPLQL